MNSNIKMFILSNISILKDIINIDKGLIFLSINKIIFSVIYPLLMSIIPKIIIDSIINKIGITNLIFKIVIISILMAGISWIDPSIKEKVATKAEKLRLQYKMQLMISLLSSNYELLGNRTKYEKAKHFIDGGEDAPSFEYIFILCNWITSIIGLLSCMILLSGKNNIMLLVFTISIVLEYFFNHKQYINKLNIKNNVFLPNIKSDYIFRKTMTTNFIRDAVIFDATDTIKNKCIKYSNQIIKELKKYNQMDLKVDLLKIIFLFSRDLIICIIVIKNILDGKQNISDFVLYFGLISVMTKWIRLYCNSQNYLLYICYSYNDYNYFHNNAVRNKSNLKYLSKNLNEIKKIEFKNISYKYGENLVIKDISLVLEKNQKIAIVGRNGSGKSTIANIICGLLKPISGKIFVNGIEVSFDDYAYLINKNISVMFQKDGLLPETILGNLSFEETCNYYKLENSLYKTNMLNIVTNLNNGINTCLIPSVNYNAPDFSGGEVQRLLMSRCFYKYTSIYLFDEPTASLDVKTENFVYRAINKEDALFVIISHRIINIMDADIIIVINEGKIEEFGNHDDLVNNKGIYYEMYKIQQKLSEN